MLDHREIVVTLEESIRRGRSDDPGSRDPQEILRGLGLLTPDGRLTRASVALFRRGEGINPDFPQLTLRLARFRGRSRDSFLDNRQYHGNAFELMRRAERFLIDWLPVAGRVIAGRLEREDTPLLPVEAVREALANAFVHRDYASGSGSVGVALYDDRLEIISPGELHFGLTPEKLLEPHESKPWNPLVASTFYRRGHIEARGRGNLKIAKLLREASLPQTVTRVDAGSVRVTFAFPSRREGVNEGVKIKRREELRLMIQAHPGLRIPDLAIRSGGVPEKTLERWIAELRAAGKIEFRGAPKTGGYHAV